MVRAVTFEAHDNLIHFRWFPRYMRLAEQCRAAGIDLSLEAATAMARACRRYEEDHHPQGGRVTPAWGDARDTAGLHAAGITEGIDTTLQRIREAAKSLPPRFPETGGFLLDPDVPAVLEALQSRGILLAVVSNMPPALNGFLDALGIAHFFSTVITCGGVDPIDPTHPSSIIKPDPRVYEAVCRALCVVPQDCLHVGDSPYDDGGFGQYGVRVVIYDPLESLPVPTERITRLMELLPLLDQARAH